MNTRGVLENRIFFRKWWFFAITVRILASLTHSHWFHPDEWCQTIEPANMIAHGFGIYSQEIGLHLRNLSWASLLAGVLKFSQWIAPNSIDFRIFCLNFFCGALDLLIVWGWMQMLDRDPDVAQTSRKAKNWSLALLLLPWFSIYESVNPRSEHLSEIAFWAALGCLSRNFWVASGFSSMATFAFRYPSGLLSLGLFVAVFLESKKRKNFKPFLHHGLGLILGLVLFGLADFWIYGRPWESLWMYLEYNLFSGSATSVFGNQSILAYSELFLWNWSTYSILIPLGAFLLVSSIYGFTVSFKKLQPWALCLFIYMVGHSLISHKEGRFMIPIETLTRWSAFVGLVLISKKMGKFQEIGSFKFFTKAKFLTPIAVGISLCANSLFFFHHLRADLWKDPGTYRELSSQLQNNSNICAILVGNNIHSIHLPFQTHPLKVPTPAIGSYQGNRDGFEKMKQSQIAWFEHSPTCKIEDSVLLQVHTPEDAWFKKEECTLLPSGILKFISRKNWDWAMNHNLITGVWYRCPSQLIGHFKGSKVLEVLTSTYGYMEALPSMNITAKELITLGQRTSPPPPGVVLPIPLNPID